MLKELLDYLHNYFAVNKCFGDFVIADGLLKYADGRELPILDGQYIRIIGSVFNDGVYKCYKDTPVDFVQNEVFNGAIWLLAIPLDVINLSDDISAWRGKYEQIDSPALSPYNSESFSGYSYSKSAPDGKANTWQSVFASRLKGYRKA